MPKARMLYAGEDLGLELANTVYALDYLGFALPPGLPSGLSSRLPLAGVLSDQVGCPSLPKAAADFPYPLRRVRYFDAESSKHLLFLTNNLEIPALTVAKIYKSRWQIELFFKWIKGHLRIKHYFGTSPNAVPMR